MRKKKRMLALAPVLALLIVGLALASTNADLPRWVLSGGASDSAAGEVGLRATLGQPVVGMVSSGEITLGQGFWLGGTVGHKLYLPLSLRGD